MGILAWFDPAKAPQLYRSGPGFRWIREHCHLLAVSIVLVSLALPGDVAAQSRDGNPGQGGLPTPGTTNPSRAPITERSPVTRSAPPAALEPGYKSYCVRHPGRCSGDYGADGHRFLMDRHRQETDRVQDRLKKERLQREQN